MLNNEGSRLKHGVFWPPFILLLAAVGFSFINKDGFTKWASGTNEWICYNFGWLFALTPVFLLGLCIVIYFSPIGKVKIGGLKAKPMLNKWNWFAVTLCTGIAVGILFWTTAEPVAILMDPPASLGFAKNSTGAATYSMASMFLQWTFSPYAIYTIPTLMFAFAYYNMRKPFSLGSMLYPLLGEKCNGVAGTAIDAICVYSLVLGMANSLALGILSIAGGISRMTFVKFSLLGWAVIDIVIVATFVISAITGLMNGIKWLCDLNGKIFLLMPIFIFVFGPFAFCMNFGLDSLGYMFTHFFEMSFFTGAVTQDQWPMWWLTYMWADWLAWAPISAVFLARISYGYTVKQVIMCNLVGTSIFGIIWAMAFAGSAIHMDLFQHIGLTQAYAQGPENVIYAFFAQYPLAKIMIPIFIFTLFLSYVTGSDAMTSAIGGLCSTGISPESPEPSIFMKILWGAILGTVAWVMIAFAGVDGVKILNNMGGFPALFLELATAAALMKVAWNPKKYDYYKEDYTADGKYIEVYDLVDGQNDAVSDLQPAMAKTVSDS